MLTPEQIAALWDLVMQITDPVNDYLIRDIARRVSQAGQLTSTAAYQVWRAQNLGMSQTEVKKRLAEYLDTTAAEIELLLTQFAAVGYRFDLERFPTTKAIPFEKNAVLQQTVQAAVKLARKDFTNLTQTLGMVGPYGKALPLQDAYRSCIDFAFKQVFTGAADYNTAIRQAVKYLAAKGVRTIDYESGVHTSLEAAVRRCVLGGLGLMQEQISQQTHDELGCDGWEITAHAASAPDHEPIQGKQYSDAAYQALNNSLVRRIGTLNCGHAAFPIILGVNTPQYTPAELEKFRTDNEKGATVDGAHYTTYQATQMQRALERSIRTRRKRILVDEATGDKDKLRNDQIKLQRLEQEYTRFSKAAGLRTQLERLEVAGFGPKNARTVTAGKSAGGGGTTPPGTPVQIGTVDFSDKKAVLAQLDAAQKETAGLDYEVNYSVTSDGKVWRVSGESSTVDPSTIPSSLQGSFAYHNHPAAETKYSFSAEDVRFFFQHGEAYAKASDHIYEYFMARTPETLAVDPNAVYYRFKELYRNQVLAMAFYGGLDMDVDGFHKTMELLSKELGFQYARREKKIT